MPAQLRQNDTGPKLIRQSAATIKYSYGNPACLELPIAYTPSFESTLANCIQWEGAKLLGRLFAEIGNNIGTSVGPGILPSR